MEKRRESDCSISGHFSDFPGGCERKIHQSAGYVTEVVAEDAFYVEDIRIVLNEGVFAELAFDEGTDTHRPSVVDLRVGAAVEIRGNQEIGSEEVLANLQWPFLQLARAAGRDNGHE